jgi:hypothetical protein
VNRARKLARLAALVFRTGAWALLADHLVYRTPARLAWARLRGHRFHRSTMFWFCERPDLHTRATLLLPRFRHDYPDVRSADLEFTLFDLSGQRVFTRRIENASIEAPFVLDSRRPPAGFSFPRPFEGMMLVTQRLGGVPDRRIVARDGLFNATHTYLDYYREGAFVTTLHDYCAYLPDQGLQTARLGMIPAYCDAEKETFLVFHAAGAGIGPRDLEVRLLGPSGLERRARLGALAPFATRRVLLSELFPDARQGLAGATGQVVVEGLFRELLTRIAYGVADRATGAFSLDHCYYSIASRGRFLTGEQRSKIAKGCFNPFLVLETDAVTTSVLIFHAAQEEPQTYDLLVYDAEGRLVLRREPFRKAEGNAVERVDMRPILESAGIPAPFLGHAELLYHREPDRRRYDRDLDVLAEYRTGNRFATVIFGADIWNPPQPVKNLTYRSGSRVVCDDLHTTLLAVSNVSYAYDYALEVPFTLNLVGGGRVLESRRFTIGPNATLYRDIEEFFPEARRLLEPWGGIGLVTTTDINTNCLTHLFFTQDRRSRALSVEHSLEV